MPMRRYASIWAVLTVMASQGMIRAQDASSAASSAASAASGAGASGSGGSNIFSMLCPTAAQIEACKAKLCACPIVQLLNAATQPLGALSGGLIHPCCPPINPADAAKPPDSAEGAAARIKKCLAEAPDKIKAIRFLQTVPCHYFPEAEAALIKSLRTDCSECVRIAAAQALGRGCCCSKKVIAALLIVVNGSDKDGNPSECSEKVRLYSMAALEHCVAVYCERSAERPEKPSPEKKDQKKEEPKAMPNHMLLTNYYYQLDRVPDELLIAEAWQTLTRHQAALPRYRGSLTGQRSLTHIYANARTTISAPPLAATTPPAPVPTMPLAPTVAANETPAMTLPTTHLSPVPQPQRSLPSLFRRASEPTQQVAAAPVPTLAEHTMSPLPGQGPPTGQRNLFSLFKRAANPQ